MESPITYTQYALYVNFGILIDIPVDLQMIAQRAAQAAGQMTS